MTVDAKWLLGRKNSGLVTSGKQSLDECVYELSPSSSHDETEPVAPQRRNPPHRSPPITHQGLSVQRNHVAGLCFKKKALRRSCGNNRQVEQWRRLQRNCSTCWFKTEITHNEFNTSVWKCVLVYNHEHKYNLPVCMCACVRVSRQKRRLSQPE